MFQSEDDFSQDQSVNTQKNSSDPNLESIDAEISTESVAVRKKQLESILVKLIIFGLALGTVLGISAYYLMHKFGLTKKPDQLEREKIEREQLQNSHTPVKKIIDFSQSDSERNRFQL